MKQRVLAVVYLMTLLFAMMIGPAVMYSASTILVFAVAIILMVSIDARLTLIALIPLPMVSVSVKYFGSAIHKRFEAIQAQLADLSAVVQEALAGVRVVRAYNQERYEIARFSAANDEYIQRNRVLIRLQGMIPSHPPSGQSTYRVRVYL